ncbi:sn-glycerol-3-phosphate transport system permease protein UgpA [Jeotgalibaca dankookensis]|uniref:sn-glycerol-3-phosphate transport system permease protein UgpA n=1 Tax=Jeotgalibaca dankookensis TaxID=708126 RepID=A0A1S6IPB2_9LACT|nr:sugar ABC transporter permease [Jeotgalibaca dankookensis]AQS53393.1 sn-glycerol-3-phosphate transport system permease protein UgpA [Jeotgalibaca dankookensis]
MHKSLKKYFPIFVGPTLIAFVLAFLIPFLLGLYLSFTEFKTVVDASWVGFENYRKAFADPSFMSALWFTVKFTVVSVISVNVLAFLLALLLTGTIKGTKLYRTVFFMPNLIGGIVLGYVWLAIINTILYGFGVTITYNPDYGFWGLVVMMNWQMIGYMMVIYISGIQNISNDLLEAAKIDGASKFQTLKSIILPLVLPSATINLFLTLTNSFKLFDQNLALTNGAPAEQTTMVALNIYKTFYGRMGWEGVGQAKAVIFFIIVGIISITQVYLTRSREVEN